MIDAMHDSAFDDNGFDDTIYASHDNTLRAIKENNYADRRFGNINSR
ncbi:hypothetical protein SAMN05216365_1077 [Porphyromonadaceae bacterium NLAE-zl-C104]|nr:hypothetical protein SAMN05216331_1167 [Porphyromonadaceae bacterium KH3R12]SFS45239.1 hypothetical protein SAMN05216365_1077 [Porphyromonadaceae bacterium NLAE-zl-C104]